MPTKHDYVVIEGTEPVGTRSRSRGFECEVEGNGAAVFFILFAVIAVGFGIRWLIFG